MMRPAHPRWRRRADVLWRRSLDAVIFLPPGESEPLTVTATGPEVWDLLAEPRSLEELAGTLAATHHADPSVVASDLAPVIEQLVALGVVDQVDD